MSASVSVDYKKLEERMARPERLVGTWFAYHSLEMYLLEINKHLELLDFVDREPIMQSLLSQITSKTEWPRIHPDIETVASTLLRDKAALFWCVSEWTLTDEAGGDYFRVGPPLDIERIFSILGLSAHERAETIRENIGGDGGESMTFDFNKLNETMKRTERMPGTNHLYDSINATLFEL